MNPFRSLHKSEIVSPITFILPFTSTPTTILSNFLLSRLRILFERLSRPISFRIDFNLTSTAIVFFTSSKVSKLKRIIHKIYIVPRNTLYNEWLHYPLFIHNFQNYVIFKITRFFKITLFFSKSRYFQSYVIFKITRYFQSHVIFQNRVIFRVTLFLITAL